MQKELIIIDNTNDNSTETFLVESVSEFLSSKFAKFPESAKIYHLHLAENCEVTPKNEAEIELLEKLEGKIYVVVYPEKALYKSIIADFTRVLNIFLPKQAVPDEPATSYQQSANNELVNRENKPRINGRWPDICGTVTSIFDLLSEYKIFENGKEIEFCYMAVGRGEYEILENNVN